LRLCLDHLRLVRRLCVKARGRLHLFHGLSRQGYSLGLRLNDAGARPDASGLPFQSNAPPGRAPPRNPVAPLTTRSIHPRPACAAKSHELQYERGAELSVCASWQSVCVRSWSKHTKVDLQRDFPPPKLPDRRSGTRSPREGLGSLPYLVRASGGRVDR
jgi:hypothetical protein